MAQLGKMLLFSGLALAAVGLLLLLGDRLGLGRLPGDLVWKPERRNGNTTVYFPWVTSLLLSVILTVLLNVFLRRK